MAPAFEKEVRFALVMYGGVSLAVYINGVAQEFYSLVRATSGQQGTGTTGTEAVYRKLGAMLGATGADLTKSAGPIRTRFVVDILSGTSAGGLNSVFLAKALACGLDFRVMRDLWIRDADIDTLLNDDGSAAHIPGFTIAPQKPPQSLLNSKRMYILLLAALNQMSGKTGHPKTNEVDLFVTATDLAGLPTTLKLADAVAEERRHRTVFHFCASPYMDPVPPPAVNTAGGPSPTRNDFQPEFDPFLAFAGRCTAAFPIAFEPMRLSDIDDVLKTCSLISDPELSISNRWRPFIVDYIPQDGAPPEPGKPAAAPYQFPNRSFADGGYLNNKPFSYAIEELGVRTGDLPYDRKLVYIEPSPETIDRQDLSGPRPDALENAFDAAFELPRYQTIREDLRRVVERNRLVQRVQDVIEQLEQTVDQEGLVQQFKRESNEKFAASTVTELGKGRGPLYAGYHRLKVKTVIDGLTRMVCAALDLDENSDELHGLYFVVRAWTREKYPLDSALLLKFDLAYRERRLFFLLSRLDCLYIRREKAEAIMSSAGLAGVIAKLGESALLEKWETTIRDLRLQPGAQSGLVKILGSIRRVRNSLRLRGADNPFPVPPAERKAWQTALHSLLHGAEDECDAKAKQLLTNPDLAVTLESVVQHIDDTFKTSFTNAAAEVDRLLPPVSADRKPEVGDVAGSLRYCLRRQYEAYDFYDAVSFPILYGTDAGALKITAVHRISPRDACSLIAEGQPGERRTKLAGDSLSAFGAFFRENWRENDMMWGRLDGAERIITMLLPDTAHTETRNALIREAQIAILRESLHEEDVERLLGRTVDAVREMRAGTPEVDAAQAALSGEDNQAVVRALVQPDALIDYVHKHYAVDKAYEPQWVLPIAARASKVTGQLLDFLSAERKWMAGPIVWVLRGTRVFWGLVEVAIPQSLSFASFRYLVRVYLLATGLVFLGSFLLGESALYVAALKLFGAGLVLDAIVQLLHDAMSGRESTLRVTSILLLLAIVACMIAGLTIGIVRGPVWIQHHVLTAWAGDVAFNLLRLAAIPAAIAALGGVLTSLPKFSTTNAEFGGPVLAMELARTPADVNAILATPGDRISMRDAQYRDFVLIIGYALFFVAMGALEFWGWHAPLWVGALTAILGAAAGVLDWKEDQLILATVSAACPDALTVAATRRVSLAKWASLAVAQIFLGVGAFAGGAPLLGVAAMASGIAGLLGCLRPRALQASVIGLGLIMLGVLVYAILKPL